MISKIKGDGKSHNAQTLERIMDPTKPNSVDPKKLGFPSAQDKEIIVPEKPLPYIKSKKIH